MSRSGHCTRNCHGNARVLCQFRAAKSISKKSTQHVQLVQSNEKLAVRYLDDENSCRKLGDLVESGKLSPILGEEMILSSISSFRQY
jgi:hypothetical protein